MTAYRSPRATLFSLAFLIFLCMAWSATSFASSPSPGFEVSMNQLAEVDYSDDFGQKIINWIAYGTETPVWGNRSLMSVISEWINAIGLFVMAWLAILGGGNFIIQTANKGVPGGQVISSFWMPIRICAATILLVPLPSGYSTLQYGVISIAEKGNAHGNIVMGAGLDHLYDFGAYRTPALEDGGPLIFSWIESEVCRQYINSYTRKETIKPVFKSVEERGQLISKLSYSYQEESTWYVRNDPRTDYCGAVTFSIAAPSITTNTQALFDTSLGESTAAYGGPPLIAAEQFNLLQAIQPEIAKIATEILRDEQALRALQDLGQSQQSTYEKAVAEVNASITSASGMYKAAHIQYNAGTQGIVASAVNKINDIKNSDKGVWNADSDNGGWREQTKEMGWPALGTIFWQINVNQSEINKLAATMAATYTDPQIDEEWGNDQRLGELSSRIRGLKKVVATNRVVVDNNQTIPSLSAIADAGAEGDGIMDKLKYSIYEFFAGAMRMMLYKNSPDDLIINLQYFGSAAGTAAEVGWWAKTITFSVAHGLLDAVKEGTSQTANSFSKYNPIGWAAKAISAKAAGVTGGIGHLLVELDSMINYLLIGLIVVGFTLGIVLPTIPLTIWFMGVISWMLFYIECLLISPIWLSAHGTAEREGWGSEHTRQGYMLMIGLYLNPILRVAGFFAIFLALKPVSYLVSWFIDYVQGVIVGGFTFLFFYFGAMIIVSIFAYSVLVRIFSLPSELFERGLRWINGGQEVTGDGSSEKEARGNFAAFGHKAESAASVKGGGKGLPGSPSPGSPTPTPTPNLGS